MPEAAESIMKSTWLEELGAELSRRRKERKLSQKQMGDLIQINRSTISSIENGTHTGSLKPVIQYLSYFKLKLKAEPISKGLPQLGDDSAFEQDDD